MTIASQEKSSSALDPLDEGAKKRGLAGKESGVLRSAIETGLCALRLKSCGFRAGTISKEKEEMARVGQVYQSEYGVNYEVVYVTRAEAVLQQEDGDDLSVWPRQLLEAMGFKLVASPALIGGGAE